MRIPYNVFLSVNSKVDQWFRGFVYVVKKKLSGLRVLRRVYELEGYRGQ